MTAIIAVMLSNDAVIDDGRSQYRWLSSHHFSNRPLDLKLTSELQRTMSALSCSSPAALIVGSVRTSNNGDGLAAWLISRFNGVANPTTRLALASELMELPLPIGPVTDPVIAAAIESPQQYADPAVQAWSRAVTATSAIVILTPQYNWGYPGHLKNLLDHLYNEWKSKPAVLVTYGGHGGTKCAEQLQLVLSGGFHMNVIAHVSISLPKEFIRSSDRVGAADIPSFLADYEMQVDEAFALLLKSL